MQPNSVIFVWENQVKPGHGKKEGNCSEDVWGVCAREAADVTLKEFAIKKKLHKQVP